MKLFVLIIILIGYNYSYGQLNVIKEGNKYYLADQLIVKFNNVSAGLSKISEKKYNINNFSKTFRSAENTDLQSEELEKIYTINNKAPFNPLSIIKELSNIDNIEWVEPHYLYELTYSPNDLHFNCNDSLHYKHLKVISAKKAWDINKGNKEIIIAIIDTGVDWEHPDLLNNIWRNSLEIENNGIDDDGNGFIDDVRGWDLGGLVGVADNNPKEDKPEHGTSVAGLASAVTDNEIGVASIGFNCSIMPVKTSQNDIRNDQGKPLITYGYEGIKYAVDNGADVINCSWGGHNYSNMAQEVIEYAISKGSLVVAAAGNNNSSKYFYPAAYKGVLSVASTNFVDQKASWTNFGTFVNVTAPGVNIYSTWQNDPLYKSQSGTSLSSPIVAGLAALVKNQFKSYTPQQIAEQIRVNTDNIYEINSTFEFMLGSGRINAFKALTNQNSKSVRVNKLKIIDDENDGIFNTGEILKVGFELVNYLNSIENLTLELSSEDPNIEIIVNNGAIGSLTTLQSVNVNTGFFEIKIKESAENNVDVNLLVKYKANNFEDFEWITIPINPTYQIHNTESLSLTFNSKGSIGFDDFPYNKKGNGLVYNDGPNLMFEGALIYGNSINTITNTARSENPNIKDDDFQVIIPITFVEQNNKADIGTYTKFNEVSTNSERLGIETEVLTYTFAEAKYSDCMMIRYSFFNTTELDIENFYVGQYWDFDLDNASYNDDVIMFDSTYKFGYAFDNDGDPVDSHIGLSLINEENMGFFAIDEKGTNDSVVTVDGFSDQEKWKTLSSKLSNSSIEASDVSVVISSGPHIIISKEKIEIDFLIAVGKNIEDLRSNIAVGREKFKQILTKVDYSLKVPNVFQLKQNYPNPFNSFTIIKYTIPFSDYIKHSNVTLKIYDILGREVVTLVDKVQLPGNYEIRFDGKNLPSGVYYYQLLNNKFRQTKKMVLVK